MSAGQNHNILAVQNPVSSQAGESDQIVAWLMGSKWGTNLDVLSTRHPREGDNVELIRERLQDNTIVISSGGDGLANDAFNAIKLEIDSGRIDPDSVYIMGLPAGNGNDFSLSLHGENLLRKGRLQAHLERLETARLDGMHLYASNPPKDFEFSKFAHSYMALGLTGLSAAYINRRDFRMSRRVSHLPARLLDGIQVLNAVKNRQPFNYEPEAGEVRSAQEILFALMPRVAGGVIIADTDPFDRKVVRIEIGDRNFVVKAVGKIGAGRLGGIKGKAMGSEQELLLKTGTPIQYDGEPFALPAGTAVKIRHLPRIVRAVI